MCTSFLDYPLIERASSFGPEVVFVASAEPLRPAAKAQPCQLDLFA
jgi:hypothetical protein